MIEVKIPVEIQEYKSKLIFGLSTRQVIAIAGALLVGVPIGVLGYGHISSDILPWIVILSVAPFAGYGFMTFKDMKFEEFMRVFLMFNFFPQQRPYEDTDMNIFVSLNEELIADNITFERIEAGEIEPYDDENGGYNIV